MLPGCEEALRLLPSERVAELLRPRVGMGGLDGAGAGSPLVNINVNTNTGGVTSLGGGSGSGGEVPSGAVAAASTSTDLYARLMQALSAKGGGGEPDASLRDAAAHFVDELAKQVGMLQGHCARWKLKLGLDPMPPTAAQPHA